MFLIKPTTNLRKFQALTSLSHRIVSTSTFRELNMTINEATLREKLNQNLKIEHLNIIDESNCNCGLKFNVVIVSDDFNGKSLIERHRMVNSILEDELKKIHAFSQKTLTVEQWKKKNENQM